MNPVLGPVPYGRDIGGKLVSRGVPSGTFGLPDDQVSVERVLWVLRVTSYFTPTGDVMSPKL